MARIKEYPSIESFDGNADALAIEQTDGANNRLRKVSPAQLKRYILNEVISVYQPANESVTVTGPYTDIAFTKPVESGYTFYLIAAVAINTANWNMSNINPVAGSIRIFTSNTSPVTNLVKTTWLKIKNL